MHRFTSLELLKRNGHKEPYVISLLLLLLFSSITSTNIIEYYDFSIVSDATTTSAAMTHSMRDSFLSVDTLVTVRYVQEVIFLVVFLSKNYQQLKMRWLKISSENKWLKIRTKRNNIGSFLFSPPPLKTFCEISEKL